MERIRPENINSPEYFNKAFKDRKFMVHYNISKVMFRATHLLERFEGGKFLDLGCGLSPCSIMASKKGAEVYAIDFSDELINSLKKQYPGIKYSLGDIRQLPYEDNFFDYAVIGEVLEHMENPNEVVKEAVRVLKVGGILSVSVPLNDSGNSPNHLWRFEESDIKKILEEFGEAETKKMKEDSYGYIIGYLKK